MDEPTRDKLIEAARAALADGVKRCGTRDVVARVRAMTNGTVDVAWLRRVDMEKRLRLGALGGAHPALGRAGREIATPAPKGSFHVLATSTNDDSDATVIVVEAQSSASGTPVAKPSS